MKKNKFKENVPKLFTITAFTVFFLLTTYSQWQNMVPNYSFEKHDLTNWNAGFNVGFYFGV